MILARLNLWGACVQPMANVPIRGVGGEFVEVSRHIAMIAIASVHRVVSGGLHSLSVHPLTLISPLLDL